MANLADQPEPAGQRSAHRETVSGPGVDPWVEEFSAFYRAFTPRLGAFLVWQGARPSVAAEIVQETMAALYRSWPRVEHREAWARTVASRAYARQIARVEEDPVETVPEHRSPLLRWDNDLDLFVERDEVLRLLELLPARQRQVMAWTFDGHTPAEIAAELKIEPGAVRASLHKARATLAAHLTTGMREVHER